MDVRVINELVQKQTAFIEKLNDEVGKVIVGQKAMVERILIGLLDRRPRAARGRARPGQDADGQDAVRRAGDASSRASSSRPTCCRPTSSAPSSTTRRRGEFTSKHGPIFANLVLADEINRAPAKVQTALLEAMQERQVTIGDETYPLPDPFLVMATQNPIEQEGTYPLPEAQVDRFMLMIKVGYPTREEERAIMDRMTRARVRDERRAGRDAARRSPRRARVVQPGLHRREDPRLHRRRRARDARAQGARPERAGRLHRVRRQPARLDLPEPGRARARVPAPPRLRHARGRQGDRPRRAAPPRRPDLRGRGRGGHRGDRGAQLFEHVEVP